MAANDRHAGSQWQPGKKGDAMDTDEITVSTAAVTCDVDPAAIVAEIQRVQEQARAGIQSLAERRRAVCEAYDARLSEIDGKITALQAALGGEPEAREKPVNGSRLAVRLTTLLNQYGGHEAAAATLAKRLGHRAVPGLLRSVRHHPDRFEVNRRGNSLFIKSLAG